MTTLSWLLNFGSDEIHLSVVTKLTLYFVRMARPSISQERLPDAKATTAANSPSGLTLLIIHPKYSTNFVIPETHYRSMTRHWLHT